MARFIIICLALLAFLGGKYSNASYINRDDQDVDVGIDVKLLGNNEDLNNLKPLLRSDKRSVQADCAPVGSYCRHNLLSTDCCPGNNINCVCVTWNCSIGVCSKV